MDKGGAQRVVSRLTDILSSEYRVYLILFEDTYNEYEYNAELINMRTPAAKGIVYKGLSIYKRIRRLKRIKMENELDIVISFLDTPNLINIMAHVKGCMVAVSIRNYTAHEISSGFIGMITKIGIKKLYNKADYIVPVSEQIADNYKRDFDISSDKLKVIYNPYDMNQLNLMSKEAISEDYIEFIDGSFVFCSVARQVYQKGYWHLIKAFSLVAERYKKAKLLIIGQDYQDGKAKALVRALNLEDSVVFAGQQDNPFKFLKHSDVYVLSSLFEGFPNSMVEAMGCGCAVIAADCKSGPREILFDVPDMNHPIDDFRHADYGIIVPPMDFKENWETEAITPEENKMAQAMVYLMENEQDLQKYRALSLKRAADFSYEECRKKFSALIEGEDIKKTN